MKTNSRPSYDEWMRQVDRLLSSTIGLTHRDLDDCPYRDWYDDHVSAPIAAARAKRRNGA